MTAKKDNLLTPEFRVSYPFLFRAQAPMDSDSGKDPKFSVVALFPLGADLTALKQAAFAAGVEKWGPDKAKWPAGLHSPFRDQSEKSGEGYVPGAVFCTFSSKYKPGVVDENVQAIIDETQVYAGCYGRATVNAYAWEFKNKQGAVMKRGISLGLQNFQKLRDGEPLAGRAKPEDEFTPVSGQGTAGASAAAQFG